MNNKTYPMERKLKTAKIIAEKKDQLLSVIEENEYSTRYHNSIVNEYYARLRYRRLRRRINIVGVIRALIYVSTLRFIWGRKL